MFTSFSGAGGVERMVMNLVREFARRGIAVDLLGIRCDSAHLRDVPGNVRLRPLRARHSRTSVGELADYLEHERPAALLVAKDRPGRAALRARRRARVDCPVVIRLGTNLSAALEGRHPLARWLRTAPMRRAYRQVDRVVAVSEGVAGDTRRITGLPAGRVTVIRNPVITPDLARRATAPCPHPWLEDGRAPVLMAAGRLTRQKDFTTLVEAFALLRRQRPARLVILGEGRLRGDLERRIGALGLAGDVILPGFTDNPYAWMARADGFVLSSRWEGSPNVLTEAMALGTPVAATDCPSGPREVLDDGRVAPLVPMGDPAALADAMGRILDRPPEPADLQAAVADYRADNSADHYLRVLGLR